MSEHFPHITMLVAGLSFLIFNKQIGQLTRKFQIAFTGRDYGLMSFRVPFAIGGVLFIVLSIITW